MSDRDRTAAKWLRNTITRSSNSSLNAPLLLRKRKTICKKMQGRQKSSLNCNQLRLMLLSYLFFYQPCEARLYHALIPSDPYHHYTGKNIKIHNTKLVIELFCISLHYR